MKKIIRLTESDLTRIVKRAINEIYGYDFSVLSHWVDKLEEVLENYGSIDCENKTKEYEKFYCKNFKGETKEEVEKIFNELENEKHRIMFDHLQKAFKRD